MCPFKKKEQTKKTSLVIGFLNLVIFLLQRYGDLHRV